MYKETIFMIFATSTLSTSYFSFPMRNTWCAAMYKGMQEYSQKEHKKTSQTTLTLWERPVYLVQNWFQSSAGTTCRCSIEYTYKPWTFMVQFS